MPNIERLDAGKWMSQVVVHGDTIYISGQVADDRSADLPVQMRQVLAKIDGLLAKAGSDKTRLLSVSVWLADISRFSEMNEVWVGWIDPANPPARATVEAKLAFPELRIEIAAIAAR